MQMDPTFLWTFNFLVSKLKFWLDYAIINDINDIDNDIDDKDDDEHDVGIKVEILARLCYNMIY